MKKLKGKRVILYIRVSTTDQKYFGNSLSNQLSMLQEFCKKNGIIIVQEFIEDYSGKNFNRPEFIKLHKYARENKQNIDYVLVYKWDRFSRDVLETMNMKATFDKLDIEINCPEQWINHEDPNQFLMFLINIGVPEVDNRIRAGRTIEGIRSNQKSGRWVSSQPKGYISGRDAFGKVLMQPDPNTAHLITSLFKDYALGIYSQNELRALPEYKGLNLTASNISRMLKQVAYAGQIRVKAYKSEPEIIVDALHEPLVTIEVFNKVQVQLNKKSRYKQKAKTINPNFPLRGHLICCRCGKNLTGSSSKGQAGAKYSYYHCNTKKGCNERVRIADAHKAVDDYLIKINPNSEVCDLFERILAEKYENTQTTNKELVKKFEADKNKLISKDEKLLNALLNETISDSTYKGEHIKIEHKIIELDVDISKLNTHQNETMKFVKYGIHFFKNMNHFFESADVTIKQKLLSSIFREKLIFENKRYRTPKLNKGIEFIFNSTKHLESVKTKNGRLSFDNLPLGTRGGT